MKKNSKKIFSLEELKKKILIEKSRGRKLSIVTVFLT